MKKGLMITAALAVTGLIRAAIQPIEGTNVVGFAAVTAEGSKNTIITVPFEACMGDGAGMLADLVATNGLTAHADDPTLADQLVVLTSFTGSAPVYCYYYLKSGSGWTAITTSLIVPDGTSQNINPPAADAFAVSRGLGFWIKRVASANPTVYVKGQVATAGQATPISSGLNLIGYGDAQPLALNTVDWSGAYGFGGISATTDRILVGKGDGTYTTYFYYVKKVGGSAYYDQFTNKWVESTSTGPALPSSSIPAGQGFWYHRRGIGGFTFRPAGQ